MSGEDIACLAEQELLHRVAVCLGSFDGEIRHAGLLVENARLGFPDRCQYGSAALLVPVDSDTQIDLAGA